MIPGDALAQPTLVFLHEGLGSRRAVARFSRQGRRPARRAGADLLALRLRPVGRAAGQAHAALHARGGAQGPPGLLDQLGIDNPLLVGHSDGASIAIIHAAAGERPVSGLALMAPHVFVEQVCVDSIARIRDTYRTGPLKSRLAKYHAHVDDAFLGWADIWLEPAVPATGPSRVWLQPWRRRCC